MLRCFFLLPLPLLAASHTITANKFYHTFHRGNPVLARIQPGDTINTKTLDAAGQDENNKQLSEPSNPLTGPFYIVGAEPGDAIAVKFERMRLNRNWGWTNYRLGLFSLTADSIETLYSRQYKDGLVHRDRADQVPWDIDLKTNTVRLREPKSSVVKFEFPARPMLGCVGVAAPADFGPTSAISGNYGGNMDYNEVVEGATLILPVFHPGALLYLGDGHALQGDGEPTGTGIETSMDVSFTVTLQKGANIPGPRIVNNDWIIAIGSQPEFVSSLDHTLKVATSHMASWLVKEYKLEPWAAHQLIGYQGKYDVVTVHGSMALRIPRRVLSGR